MITKDYLLLSEGKDGFFQFECDTLDEAINKGELQLKAGRQCSVFVRHSDLRPGEVQVIKSQIQLDIEAKEAAAIAVEIKP